MTELMTFRRQGNERIDDLLLRFDLVRSRANQEGRVALSTQGLAWLLLLLSHWQW